MLLDQTKAEKLSHLDALRRDRGTALLDKGEVPRGLRDQIREAEGDIYAIDEAIGVQVRRDRVIAENERLLAAAAVLASLKLQELARLEAIGRAQAAAEALRAALKDTLLINAEVGRLCVNAGGAMPIAFSAHELERRLSGWLAVALSSLNSRRRFGVLSWTFAGDVAFARDAGKTWHETETDLGARALDSILNPKETE